MNYPLVSVIIPVYQAEKFLRECLESVGMQDYPELEIILVNDGSTDHSPEICAESARADKRIRILNQKNAGFAASRNAGIAAAEGKYHRWKENGESVECRSSLEDEDPDSIAFRFKGFFQSGSLSYNWGKLYRREFLTEHELWVPQYTYAEDKAHNFRCCACDPKYAFVPQSIVLYRENLQSLTFRPKKRLMKNWIQIAADFETFLKEHRIAEDYGDIMLFHLVIGAMYLAKEEMTYRGKKIRVVRSFLKWYGEDPFVRKTLTFGNCLRYATKIKSVFWKLLTFTLVLFFRLHAYYFLSAILVLMSRLGIDSL